MTINGNFTSSGNLIFEIAGLGTGLYDVLDINGSAIFTGGNIEFDFINGYSPLAGESWDFLLANTVTGWDTLSFTFNGLDASLGGGFILTTDGVDFTVASVPEPSNLLLLASSGLAGLGGMAWRRHRRG